MTTPIVVTAETCKRAHDALDQWLSDCVTRAEQSHADGRSGLVGRFRLSAFGDDIEVTLQITRSIVEDL